MNTDARIIKSTESILNAGLELLTKNKDTKLTDVAVAAGVGRATLYRLFKNKDDLVLAIASHCLDKYEVATQPIEQKAKSALHAMELLFHYTMPLTLEFQFLSKLDYFLESNPAIDQINKQYKNEMVELIEEIRQEIKIDNKIPNSWLFNLVDGLFYAGWVQQTEEGCTANQAAELAYSCFEKSVR